ncbi:MAG TPA: hypothetical protein VFW27_03465 [Actinoplanes sp.]|nr:hypothetical protein [Actinoplanes sp.]
MTGRRLHIDRAAFAWDWCRGMLVVEMAAKYGCSKATISTTAQRFGLPRRHGGELLELALTGGEWLPGRHGVLHWSVA